MKYRKNEDLQQLSREEMASVSAGALPPIQVLSFKTPTWKYVEGTPQWAINAALAVGYEVEKLD